MSSPDASERPILDHLESLQDHVLAELEQLNQRLEATLANLGVRTGRSKSADEGLTGPHWPPASEGSPAEESSAADNDIDR